MPGSARFPVLFCGRERKSEQIGRSKEPVAAHSETKCSALEESRRRMARPGKPPPHPVGGARRVAPPHPPLFLTSEAPEPADAPAASPKQGIARSPTCALLPPAR